MKNINKLTLFSSLLLASSALVAAPLTTKTGFVYPANKTLIDSIYMGFNDKDPNFSNRCHLANDYNLSEGSPVYATTSGIVRRTTNKFQGDLAGSAGIADAMIIEHKTSTGQKFYAVYGHLRNMQVSVGDTVQQGQQIAQVGRFISGGKHDPHLHFAINTEKLSYHAHTPTPSCTDKLGFVDPEDFMLDHYTAQGSCNAVDNEVSTPQNRSVDIPNVLANDTDVDNDPLVLLSADSTSKNGVAISNNGDGTFRYTPEINFKGADSFKYRITDNKGCIDTATVYINVTQAENNGGGSGGGGSFNTFSIAGLLLLLFTRRFRKILKTKQ